MNLAESQPEKLNELRMLLDEWWPTSLDRHSESSGDPRRPRGTGNRTDSDSRPTKPNVLFIAIDDMNDYVGCLGGHPDGWTPNIDRLAARGTLFSNAHTAAPVCNPSRAAFLSGLGPFTTGIYHNGDPWPKSAALRAATYLPEHFQAHGYHTMLGGKIFHGPPQGHTDDKGLDEYAGNFGGQSFGVKADDFPDPFEDRAGIHNFAVHWGGLDGEKADQLADPKLAAWAADRLSKQYDKPFLLMVGFHRPHTPLTSPKTFYDMFDRQQLALPPLNPSDLKDMPWMGKQVAVGGYQEMEGGHYKTITERGHHRDILKGYLAACSFVDAQVGQVLEALDRSPHRDNTIVVLFSDHGWGVGERYHFKKWGLWDDTTRVPFIVHVPWLRRCAARFSELSESSRRDERLPDSESQATVSDAGVTLLDIYPTLVDLCGIDSPSQPLDGRSLRPLLQQPDADWNRPALTTYGQNNYALRTPRWRYIRWSDGSEELYDHDADSHEWHNVADKPDHADVKASLTKWFPKSSVISVASDHRSPVTLTRKDRVRHFRSIQPTFVGQPITVKATIGPQITDGVILSHGGQFCGYSLYVKDGRLTMSIMDVPSPLYWNRLTPTRTIFTAESPLESGKPYEVTGTLLKDGTVRLAVDGSEVARGRSKTLSIHPAGPMQLGVSPPRYVPIGEYVPPFLFKGQIQEVTVEFGGDEVESTSTKEE
jgi:arylsulfatase A-like enzyme